MESDDLKSLKDMLRQERDAQKNLEELIQSSQQQKHWTAGIVNITTMMLLLIGLIGSFITAYINLDKSISLITLEQKRFVSDIVSLKSECKERAIIVRKLEVEVMGLQYKMDALNTRTRQ